MMETLGVSGQVCNNFFFILAGFMLILNFHKTQKLIDFIKHRAIRILPVMATIFILYLILSFFSTIHFKKYDNIFALLFLNNLGISLKGNNICGSWFISVLMGVSCFYFYIYKHFPKYISDFITCIITMLCFAFLINAFNGCIDPNPRMSFYYVFNAGVMQGLANMGLGIIMYNLYCEYLNRHELSHENDSSLLFKLIFTFFEGFLFFFLVNNLTFHKISFNNEMIFILAFCALLFLFLIKRGLISRGLNNNFSKALGKYTFSIYLTHGFVIHLIAVFIWSKHLDFILNHPVFQIVFVLCMSVLGGIIMYHLVEKPATVKLKKFDKKVK